MAEKIVLDRESFKALASETRISILKALDGKRMTITQLSDSLNVSKPALLRHMEALMGARLVSKEEKERRWIYYDLTFRGKNVLHPERVAVTVLLTTAIISLAGAIAGFFKYVLGTATTQLAGGREGGGASSAGYYSPVVPESEALQNAYLQTATHDPAMLYIGIALVVIFAVLIALAVVVKEKYGKSRF